ncbi:hypothetical protein AQ878_21210 [Burkholderia pseudomallei]|nr:hypothetical protein AQ878_21210 [Burkholderia pseudomallei]
MLLKCVYGYFRELPIARVAFMTLYQLEGTAVRIRAAIDSVYDTGSLKAEYLGPPWSHAQHPGAQVGRLDCTE